MPKQIPYGIANYVEIVADNCYFIDKTAYIKILERLKNPIFLRPRKFGKSLWCRILECYYNINQKDEFDYLFGDTYIGQHPTGKQNSYFVLHLDFSVIDPTGTLAEIERNFNHFCNLRLQGIMRLNNEWFQNRVEVDLKGKATANLETVLRTI